MKAENPTPAECKFERPGGCEEWMENYRAMASPLNPMIPSDWRKDLELTDLPTGEAAKQECNALMKWQEGRTTAQEGQIEEQAQALSWAVAPLWKVVGFDPVALNIEALIDLEATVLDCMRAPIFLLKIDVNRGRPGCCCTDSLAPKVLRPMFPLGDAYQAGHPKHPGHPAYPSGHATYAFAMALVLAEIRPGCKGKLDEAARLVAINREIAGLHFASDTKAGEELATHLVALLMKNNPAFKTKLEAARTSWPKLSAPPC